MLEVIPQTAWIRVLDYLGFIDSCQLRNINKSIKDRIDEDIFYIYKRVEGKPDPVSEYLNYKINYPTMLLNKVDVPVQNFKNIGYTFQMIRHFNLIDIIENYDLFKCPIRRAQINELNTNKLLKIIKLVNTGLSEHYTFKCIPLPNERIDWAIQLKSQDICDIFCYRGACEFNKSQKNNFLRVQKHTFQDSFAFKAAEQLNDEQIDTVIEKKNQGLLDYYAIEQAGCVNIFEH